MQKNELAAKRMRRAVRQEAGKPITGMGGIVAMPKDLTPGEMEDVLQEKIDRLVFTVVEQANADEREDYLRQACMLMLVSAWDCLTALEGRRKDLDEFVRSIADEAAAGKPDGKFGMLHRKGRP